MVSAEVSERRRDLRRREVNEEDELTGLRDKTAGS